MFLANFYYITEAVIAQDGENMAILAYIGYQLLLLLLLL